MGTFVVWGLKRQMDNKLNKPTKPAAPDVDRPRTGWLQRKTPVML